MDDPTPGTSSAPLEIELARLARWLPASGARVLVIVEGRDGAGKGSLIRRLSARLDPRTTRVVALPRPTERERGEWYFQRYVAHLPAAGELVWFDRSWYNRAGVEAVNGFCTPAQTAEFLRDAPEFERLLVRGGLVLVKLWLEVTREEQSRRLARREAEAHLRPWRATPLDRAAAARFEEYTRAAEATLRATSTRECPWTVIAADDKRAARMAAARAVLRALDYEGRDPSVLGVDPA